MHYWDAGVSGVPDMARKSKRTLMDVVGHCVKQQRGLLHPFDLPIHLRPRQATATGPHTLVCLLHLSAA